MQRIQVQTAQNVRIGYEVASVGDRIVAFLLDLILMFLIYFGFLSFFDWIDFEPSTVLMILFSLPFLLYHLVFEVFFNGQSLGKMALKIKVVMLDGSQPSISAYMLRWLFRSVDITVTTGVAALTTILINGKGQRLGDLAAGTSVVKLQSVVSVQRHELIKEQASDYSITFSAVDELSDRDISVILETLKTYKISGNKVPVLAAERKVKDLLSIDSELPSVKFLYTIVGDYNHLTSGK
jgi:uncharacterized RDD family membrane protein YckC